MAQTATSPPAKRTNGLFRGRPCRVSCRVKPVPRDVPTLGRQRNQLGWLRTTQRRGAGRVACTPHACARRHVTRAERARRRRKTDAHLACSSRRAPRDGTLGDGDVTL